MNKYWRFCHALPVGQLRLFLSLFSMTLDREHYRHILRFCYDKRLSAAVACREIVCVYGQDAISKCTCERWFKAFQEGKTYVEDKPRSVRPTIVHPKLLHATLERDPGASSVEISVDVPCSSRMCTVARHLHSLGYSYRRPGQTPHDLTESDKQRRGTLCIELLSQRHKGHFVDRIVTRDEKWITFNNPVRRNIWVKRRQQALGMPKVDFRQTKRMLCVWWSSTGVIHWELLRREGGQTVNADLYCSQLERTQMALRSLRPAMVNRQQVFFLQDNATPHKAKRTI